jgi:predicted RNA methylase
MCEREREREGERLVPLSSVGGGSVGLTLLLVGRIKTYAVSIDLCTKKKQVLKTKLNQKLVFLTVFCHIKCRMEDVNHVEHKLNNNNNNNNNTVNNDMCFKNKIVFTGATK